MKKKGFFTVFFLFGWITLASATPISWVTTSPVSGGVNFNGESLLLGGLGNEKHGQSIGIYGAGFYTALGGELDLSLALKTWDSWNSYQGYFDRLVISTSSQGFFWNAKNNQSILAQLGGNSWTNQTLESLSFQDSLTLEENTYFSFFLETRVDKLYSSKGTGNFNFSENIAPVPEPATMVLFGFGLAGLAGFRKRRKK